jgi:hypothetical protein
LLTPWTRPLSTRIGRLGLLLALLVLAACQRDVEPVEDAPDEPVAAVEALAAALRDGDLRRFSELSVPPSLHVRQRELWEAQRQARGEDDAAEAARFDALMAQLTAPDAEQVLWAKAEPRLMAFQQEAGPKWPLGVSMMAGFARAAIAANERLSAPEKGHATALVDTFAAWAGDPARVTDRERARRALQQVVATARELDVPDSAALRALDYDAMLERAGVAFRGAKAVAAIYGIDADAALSGVKAEVIALEPTRAVLRVRYPLLGEQVQFEQTMRLVDGGWYREDALQALEVATAAASPALVDATSDAAADVDAVAPVGTGR